MKFVLDENLSWRIANVGRSPGLDVVSAEEAGTLRRDDESQLGLAASEGRCLVTLNRDDFQALTLSFAEGGRAHFGVLIVPSTMPSDDFRMIALTLVDYDQRHPEGISPYTVDFLPRPSM